MARTKPPPLRNEQSGTTGTGGELHQKPTAGSALLTTNQGVLICRKPKFAQSGSARAHIARRFHSSRKNYPL